MDWTPLKPSRWVLGVIQSSLHSIYQVYVLFFNFYAYFGDSSLAQLWFILSLLDPSPAQDIKQVGLKRQETPLIGEDPRVLASISHGGEDTNDSQYETDEEQDDEFPQSEDDDSPEFAGKEMSIFILASVD